MIWPKISRRFRIQIDTIMCFGAFEPSAIPYSSPKIDDGFAKNLKEVLKLIKKFITQYFRSCVSFLGVTKLLRMNFHDFLILWSNFKQNTGRDGRWKRSRKRFENHTKTVRLSKNESMNFKQRQQICRRNMVLDTNKKPKFGLLVLPNHLKKWW